MNKNEQNTAIRFKIVEKYGRDSNNEWHHHTVRAYKEWRIVGDGKHESFVRVIKDDGTKYGELVKNFPTLKQAREFVAQQVLGNLKEENRIEEKKRTLRIAKCLQGEPVCEINDRQAPHKGMKAAKIWASNLFNAWGNKAVSPELGEIVLNYKSVNDSLAHSISPFKIEAFRSIKDVIEKGVVITQTQVGREDHYFISAPIVLENQTDIVTVLVRRDMNDKQRMYLHSVMIREHILQKNFAQKNTPEHLVRTADTEVSERSRKLYSGDTGRILQNYLKVNISQLEVEINQQIEQKGNKMDEQQQQAIETALKTYPELSREDLTLAANFKATQTPIMQNFEDYMVPLEERRTIQSFRQLPIATIAMYVSTGNNAGEYWRHAMQDYVQAAQDIEKFASENPQVSPVQWARTTGNTYAGNGMAGKLIDSSNLFVEEIAQRPALKPFLDTYNANPDILQNASPTDIEIAVSQERLPESHRQQQFVADTMAKYPIKDGEPSIVWSLPLNDDSANRSIPNLARMSVQAAETIYSRLDEMVAQEKRGYDTVIISGEEINPESHRGRTGLFGYRFELGGNDGSLLGALAIDKMHHKDLLKLATYLTPETQNRLLERLSQPTADYAYDLTETMLENKKAFAELLQTQIQQQTKQATYSQENPYAAYAKDNEDVRQNADDWEMREPLTSEKLSHFNELAQKQGFTTYVENHHADTGVFQADKEIDKTYHIEITGQFKNHGSQDAFESARDFTMTFHQGDEIVHYFYTNQLDKALEQAAEFSKNPAQWIENKDKTVEQHLSDLVDETVAIMQKHSVIEQNRLPETSSQMQTPFDKKVREYVQLKADIRENETQQAEIWGAKDFVDEMKSLQEKHDELMTQKTQIEKEYPTIWQAAERLEQQQMAEMAKNANLSGNLKDKVKEVHQELAVESLEFQFTHKGLADRTATFNQQLQQLAPEQLKELQPYFEQHKAIQTLQDLYKQTGDNARLDEMQEHNRLIEWKIHNKVEAYLGKHIDYSDMDYYKGIKTGEELRQMMNGEQRLPENANRHIEHSKISQDSSPALQGANDGVENRQSEKQSSVDEPKNFVQNQENINQTPQNSIEKSTSSIKNEKIPTRDLTGDISSPEIFQEKVMFAKVEETQITQMIDEIAKSRTYLAVDFDNKDAAKAAGAKYDPQAKGWFAEEITPELRQFLPQQPENITAERKALSDFQRQAETIGLDMANFKEVFGSWQRVPIKGKGKTNADGGYKLYRNDDGSIGACAKNYSTGDSVAWNDRLKDGKQIQSKVPLPDYLANQKQKEWNTVAQHTAQSNVAAMRGEVAANAYHQLQPALATDPYIQNKGISDIGKLKRLNDGSTIVPLYHNGKIANLQMIRPNGEKRLMSQAAKVGAYYSIGNTKTPQAVIVAEGVATADSVHQIASEIYGKDKVLVLAAIDSGNLHNVVAKVEQAFPQTEKLIAADNDAHNATRSELKFKNAGLDKANEVQEAYPNFQVALCPALNDEKGQVKNTDWNDFLKAHGKTEAVKAFAQNDKYIAQQKATTLPETENSRNQDKGGKERSL